MKKLLIITLIGLFFPKYAFAAYEGPVVVLL